VELAAFDAVAAFIACPPEVTACLTAAAVVAAGEVAAFTLCGGCVAIVVIGCCAAGAAAFTEIGLETIPDALLETSGCCNCGAAAFTETIFCAGIIPADCVTCADEVVTTGVPVEIGALGVTAVVTPGAAAAGVFGVANPPGETGETGEPEELGETGVTATGVSGETGETGEIADAGFTPVDEFVVCVVPIAALGPDPLDGATNKSCVVPELEEERDRK
jgi:hypothetical protein